MEALHRGHWTAQNSGVSKAEAAEETDVKTELKNADMGTPLYNVRKPLK